MFSSKSPRLSCAVFVRTRSPRRVQHPRCFSCTSSIWAADRPRSTLSSIWVPTGGITPTQEETGYDKLVRAGFLRQSQSGIFHMLPFGARVQEKIERLLDKHMQSLGASRVSLSSITSEELWRKSGRLDKVAPELFRLQDRKEVPLLLAPTHEEEITTLVAGSLKSYKDLPLRLYQVTRKYRDEIRPRYGLLRSREFIMKDLYSFDLTYESAFETYHQVSAAYRAFFDELKLPIIVAEASSGDMGGDLSHEYHLPDAIGADTVATCDSCGYAANDEVATSRLATDEDSASGDARPPFCLWRGISKDRKTFVNAWLYKSRDDITKEDVNIHAVKAVVPDLDTSIAVNPMPLWEATWEEATKESSDKPKLVNVVDSRLASTAKRLSSSPKIVPPQFRPSVEQKFITKGKDGMALNLVRLQDGDGCPRCDAGTLKIHRALELAHTFYLGTRYSEPLGARVALPQSPKKPVPVQMGCYGIGISRILGTVAEHMADEKGLNWPRAIAPFEVVIVPTSDATPEILDLYDRLAGSDDGGSDTAIDVVLDDRKQTFGWKIRDADTTGYPVVVILGKGWREDRTCEVQCRRLSVKEDVPVDKVPEFLKELLAKL